MEGVGREGVERGKVLAIIDEQVLRVCSHSSCRLFGSCEIEEVIMRKKTVKDMKWQKMKEKYGK